MKILKKNILLVDAFKIRNMLDDDFGIFHGFSNTASSFAPKYYIPKNEYWLDFRHKTEKEFLFHAENIKIPKNIKNAKGIRGYIRSKLCLPPPIPNFIISRKRKNGIAVVTVAGDIIRKYLDPEFILGGHEFVYWYIPKNEIWIEKAVDKEEILFIVLHEEVERKFMKAGKPYDIAHEYATVADKEMRRKKGFGSYPGDATYLWRSVSNKNLIKKFYV